MFSHKNQSIVKERLVKCVDKCLPAGDVALKGEDSWLAAAGQCWAYDKAGGRKEKSFFSEVGHWIGNMMVNSSDVA